MRFWGGDSDNGSTVKKRWLNKMGKGSKTVIQGL